MRGSTAAGRIVVGARACDARSGTVRCAVVTSAAACMLAHDLDVDDCPDSPSPPQRMSVIERARHVQGLAERRVRRARPSKPRAGTVTSLSARTLTGGDVGIGRDVRPSYVQVGAGARMHGFTTCGGRALPSIRTLDNMDTPLSRRTDPANSRAPGAQIQRRLRKGLQFRRRPHTTVAGRDSHPLRNSALSRRTE